LSQLLGRHDDRLHRRLVEKRTGIAFTVTVPNPDGSIKSVDNNARCSPMGA
jgi:hypothetical protein